MSGDKKVNPIGPLWLMAMSGTAASIGEVATIPFDTAKVRLQNQVVALDGSRQYKGLMDVLRQMVKTEGGMSPWKGSVPGVQRQLAFAPIRIGLYEPVKNFYLGLGGGDIHRDPSIPIRIAAGLTTSAIGITVACPTDVVKIRLQAEGRLAPGTPRRYNGVVDAYRKIVAQEGVKGLWTGYGPNLIRNSVVNATELVTYDLVKNFLVSSPLFPFDGGVPVHMASGLGAGLAATLLGSPVDVVKTRVMSAKEKSMTPLKMARHMLTHEGPLAFYKGFIPNFVRIGSWNIITWASLEQLKKAYLANRDGIAAEN